MFGSMYRIVYEISNVIVHLIFCWVVVCDICIFQIVQPVSYTHLFRLYLQISGLILKDEEIECVLFNIIPNNIPFKLYIHSYNYCVCPWYQTWA